MYCFAKICRFCLSHDSVLIHCRARDKNNIPNYHKIKILFPQLVNKTSQHFPIWICIKCQEQVNQSYEFKQKCYKTYKLLKKYSVQLYEANKDKNIPNVPTEIFQEVKPIIDNKIISIDEEDNSESYYNADDITIVKNELLPSNFKNEPEFHNMIQELIDNNLETIRQIDGSANSITLKRELMNNSEINLNNTNNARLVQEDEAQQISSLNTSENNNESVQTNISAADDGNGCNNTRNPLDATAFTLDYTNASFETFASHVAPRLNVTPEPITTFNVINNEESTAENLSNCCTRVLRRRKSICYRTMEKSLEEMDNIKTSEKVRKRSSSSAKKTDKTVKQISTEKEEKIVKNSIRGKSVSSSVDLSVQKTAKHLKKIKSITPKPSVTRKSKLIEKVTKEHKQKYGAYFCEKCSKQYIMYYKYRLHSSKCTGIVKHQCAECQKFFSSAASLRRHGKTHLIFKLKMNCDLCQNQYSTEIGLRNHIRARHNLFIDTMNPFF